jgi:nucleoside-diphosphate-sugar epimerase
VTGADGFIGRALCRRLTAMGVRVYRLVHGQPGTDRIVVDLGRDPVELKAIRPEAVFHLAGRVHRPDQGTQAEAEHMRVTVEGTRSVLQAAIDAHARVFVFFSTCAVMAEGSRQELDETAQPKPTSAYARAKLQAEELVLSMNGIDGLRTVCLRLPMVYGPGHKGNLPQMIKTIERGLFPPLPDFGGRRSLLHVDDAVDAALLVAQTPEAAGNVYVVAEPRAYSSREIYELVVKSLGRRPPRWRIPRGVFDALARIGDLGGAILSRRMPFDSRKLDKLSQSAWYSAGRIKRELGFEASRSFESTVPQLITHTLT